MSGEPPRSWHELPKPGERKGDAAARPVYRFRCYRRVRILLLLLLLELGQGQGAAPCECHQPAALQLHARATYSGGARYSKVEGRDGREVDRGDSCDFFDHNGHLHGAGNPTKARRAAGWGGIRTQPILEPQSGGSQALSGVTSAGPAHKEEHTRRSTGAAAAKDERGGWVPQQRHGRRRLIPPPLPP